MDRDELQKVLENVGETVDRVLARAEFILDSAREKDLCPGTAHLMVDTLFQAGFLFLSDEQMFRSFITRMIDATYNGSRAIHDFDENPTPELEQAVKEHARQALALGQEMKQMLDQDRMLQRASFEGKAH